MVSTTKIKLLFSAFTLIEVMVVLSTFAILAVLVTYTVTYSLRGAKKSENQSVVRSEMEYATAIIERQLRNANEVVLCEGSSTEINYKDQYGSSIGFGCINGGDNTYIASISGEVNKVYTPLTSNKVDLTECNFDCVVDSESPGIPASIEISLVGIGTAISGAEGASVSLNTTVMLRNY